MIKVAASVFVVNSMFLSPIPPLDSTHFPESGHWHNPERPGEGVFVDRQGGVVSFTIFTYDVDGNPEFYVAGGALEPITDLGHGQQKISARLGKTKNGPVLNSTDRYRFGDGLAYQSEEVGNLTAIFEGANRLKITVSLDERHVPRGSEALRENYYERLAFGYEKLGTNIDPDRAMLDSNCWVDLRGRWIFTSGRAQENEPLYSFYFTGLETNPEITNMTCNGSEMSHVLIYSDDQGNQLRCISSGANLSALEISAAEHEKGRCVLRNSSGEGDPILWFAVSDIGLKQILASVGAPPEDEQTVSEGSTSLLQGVRVQ